MSEQDKNPFEQMAEDFFGQAAKYIKDTMEEIKGGKDEGGTPPPEPKNDPKPEPKDDKPAPKKHFWFGEID